MGLDKSDSVGAQLADRAFHFEVDEAFEF
ncbi:MAG: hypothetical protein RLZZ282_21, partial [Verrucomicrobiota bacterium]